MSTWGYFLRFDDETIEKMVINEKQESHNDDNVVYVAFEDFKDFKWIKMIHLRMVSVKNPKLSARNVIPTQFIKEYMFLNQGCAEHMQEYSDMKTQLRFSNRDIEVLIKIKGISEPYRVICYEEIINTMEMPEFEYDMVWKPKSDRAPVPVRDISPESERETPPCHAQKTEAQTK